MNEHGTWSKHLTSHRSICIIQLIIEILPKIYMFERSTKTECPSLSSPVLSKPIAYLGIEMNYCS
jgi:hypothetical protein